MDLCELMYANKARAACGELCWFGAEKVIIKSITSVPTIMSALFCAKNYCKGEDLAKLAMSAAALTASFVAGPAIKMCADSCTNACTECADDRKCTCKEMDNISAELRDGDRRPSTIIQIGKNIIEVKENEIYTVTKNGIAVQTI